MEVIFLGKIVSIANQKGGVRKDYNCSQFKHYPCQERKESVDD